MAVTLNEAPHISINSEEYVSYQIVETTMNQNEDLPKMDDRTHQAGVCIEELQN